MDVLGRKIVTTSHSAPPENWVIWSKETDFESLIFFMFIMLCWVQIFFARPFGS